MAKVLLDPITRIEGHLSIEIDVQNGKVVDAKSIGNMYRGFEKILRGRNPLDANQITQRICGVCPVSHGLASSKCLDAAFRHPGFAFVDAKSQCTSNYGRRLGYRTAYDMLEHFKTAYRINDGAQTLADDEIGITA